MKKIGLIVAAEKECENLLKKLGKCKIISLYEDFCVKKFKYKGVEIYFAACGMGELRAAVCVQRLVDNFGVQAIINFGVAGGLKRGTRGNIYIVSGVAHYDYDTTAIDNVTLGQYDIFDSPVISTNEYICNVAGFILPSAEYAVCASGDKFITDPTVKDNLISEFGATVCDMESAGVLIASKLCDLPCGIFKIVSDDAADPNDYYDFLKNMTDALNDLILKLVERLR